MAVVSSAVKQVRQRLSKAGPPGLVYEVEVVAQHGAELPLPPGTRAMFVLKRRNRLCVTEAEAVDVSSGVEWNTRCTQTATLVKEGASWRPKEFIFKVQAVRDNPRLGQEAAITVAKAALDLSQFCGAEPFGPKQLVIPLHPSGVLHCSVRTQWLANFNQDADTLTDISHLSLGQSVATSAPGAPLVSVEAEQDLSGFDSSAAAASAAAGLAGMSLDGAGGSIRAVYPPGSAAAGGNGSGGAGAASAGAPVGASPALKKRLSAAVMRLPRRGGSIKEPAAQPAGGSSAVAAPAQGFAFGRPAAGVSSAGQAPAQLHRSFTAPALGSAGRRPPGASVLQIPDGFAAAAAAAAAAPGGEAATPKLFGRQGGRQQQQRQQAAAVGLPPEAWSPIDLQEAVQQLYDSDEEATPKPTVLATVKRMFGRARPATPVPPGTTARQLHATFGTPQPTPPKCTPNPAEVATIDRDGSVSTLRRRCKRMMAERDEARAEGYAEAALAVEQSVEIDKLQRSKDMLLARLHTTEAQLLACYRDEASTDLIQALAAARVDAATRDFEIMELQGQLRKRDQLIDKLRAQLTRAEAKYRASINALSPGRSAAPLPPSPCTTSAASCQPPGAAESPAAAAAAAAAATQQQQQWWRAGSLVLHDNPLHSLGSMAGAETGPGASSIDLAVDRTSRPSSYAEMAA